MKTLVVVPHLDDETFSCGGLIQARRAAKYGVKVIAVFGRKYKNESTKKSFDKEFEDFKKAAKILDFEYGAYNFAEGEPQQTGYYKILDLLEEEIAVFGPTELVLPSSNDRNQDHEFMAKIGKILCRPWLLQEVGCNRVLEYFALDGNIHVGRNYFVPMTGSMLAKKHEAMLRYQREYRLYPHPRSQDAVTALMMLNGSACGVTYAEAFRVIWEVEKCEWL